MAYLKTILLVSRKKKLKNKGGKRNYGKACNWKERLINLV